MTSLTLHNEYKFIYWKIYNNSKNIIISILSNFGQEVEYLCHIHSFVIHKHKVSPDRTRIKKENLHSPPSRTNSIISNHLVQAAIFVLRPKSALRLILNFVIRIPLVFLDRTWKGGHPSVSLCVSVTTRRVPVLAKII